MVWVDVASLEGGEQEFNWCGIIAVGSSVEYWNSQSFHKLDGALAGVIRGIVKEDDCVLSPVCIFLVQLQHQLPQVNLHDFVVGVGLQ